jgi:hypothetical protein
VATDKLTSILINSQLPKYIKDDYPTFIAFLESYYEYLQVNKPKLQDGRLIERTKNLKSYGDIDQTLTDFTNKFYSEFLALIPLNINADKALLLKNIKDFYRARGTEKSYKFLLRLLSAKEDVDFYYPKVDILRASDGKWYIQKTLRVIDVQKDNVITDNIQSLLSFTGQKVVGNTSNGTAIVDKVDHFYDGGLLIDELTLSSITGEFKGGEVIKTTYTDSEGTHQLKANITSGVIVRVNVIHGGSGYSIGDPVTFTHPYGENGLAEVDSVTTGSISRANVVYGGAGFIIGNPLLISGGGGSGAAGSVLTVDSSGVIHPNTYIICSSTIDLEANTLIGNTVYSNLNGSNANTVVANSVSTFIFGNCGPALFLTMSAVGDGYTSIPTMGIIANTRIATLGILGRMEINNGGLGYAIADEIQFVNVIGGHGTGARANVTNVAANGMITQVKFQQLGGHIIGGWGYDMSFLPTCNVVTTTGSGANITITSVLGDGESLTTGLTTIGTILTIKILDGGHGYNTRPNVVLTASGDGMATANADIIDGLYTYPGRYVNDDGHLSAFNFLQDRDYYQNFSYVVRMKESLTKYRHAVLDLLHPAGTKLFAEYTFESSNINTPQISNASSFIERTEVSRYTPNVIWFDGQTNFIRKQNSLNVANGRTGTFSAWFKLNNAPSAGDTQYLLAFGSSANSGIYLSNTTSANSGTSVRVNFQFKSAGSIVALSMRTDSDTHPIEVNTWYHIVASWNTAAAASQTRIYLDNVASKTIATLNASPIIDYTDTSNIIIGSTDSGASKFDGYISQLLFSNTYVDLSNNQNMLMFANNLLPTNVQSTFTGNKVILMKGDYLSANVNSGNGGQFAISNGTFQQASANDDLTG